MSVLILLVAFLFTPLPVSNGPSAFESDTYPKNHDIDMVHYSFGLTLSDEIDVIRARATIQARYLKSGQTQLRLDLVEASEDGGMTIDSISVAGQPVSYEHRDDQIFIDLPYEPASDELITVIIKYHGKPADGLQIGPNKHGDRTFFSNNWPNRARHWLPTVDHPYDKATSEMRVTAPAHYQVVSNGLMVEETDLGGGVRFTHWKQSVPIATWLYVLGVAEFARETYDTFNGKDLQTWVYKQDRDAGFYDFAIPSKHVLQYYSDEIGPYVYEKLANIQSSSVGGGMEAASAVFYSERSVTGNRNRGWQHVIIHEIAHQWFGNSVTESDWDDVWLSEGFATYFTLLFREHNYGRDDFVEGLKNARSRVLEFYDDRFDYTIIHDNLDDMSQVTTGMQYQKGAWVLHMMRRLLGTETFWDGIRVYYARHMNSNASTADFRRAMEEVSGQELGWFFDQWLYGGGVPHLEGRWRNSSEGVYLRLEQVQNEQYRFDIPIEVAFVHDDGARTRHVLDMPTTGYVEQVIPVDSEVVDVVIDPETWLLARWSIEHSR